jgi:cytochrome P450
MATAVADLPESLVVDFDVYDPSLCIPEDTFQERAAELAAQGPVLYSTAHGGHWLVTSYDEVQEVLNDPQTFSSSRNFIAGGGDGKFIPVEADPPEHTAYRNVLRPMFGPKRMNALEGEIREIVTELIDGFIERGECEYVAEFAHELPSRVFLALMGLPLEDAPRFTRWTRAMLLGTPDGTEEQSNQLRAEVTAEIHGYFSGVITEHRGDRLTPDSDVKSMMINTPAKFPDGERLLTDDELLRMFFVVLTAGLHTTQGSLGWGILHLSQKEEARRRLIDDPSRLPQAIEEILRIEAAASPGRRATRDVELGGMQIHKDDQLILLLCTANRDEEQFSDPDAVRFDREHNRHLSFGFGIHRCIGAHLARVELRIAFEEIHKRLPDYELAGPPVFHSSQARGVLSMPLKFTPGRKSTEAAG